MNRSSSVETSAVETGTQEVVGQVKWFDESKGYGFIVVKDVNRDVFVHHTDIVKMEGRRRLEEGQEVRLEIEEVPRGLQARKVEVVREAEE